MGVRHRLIHGSAVALLAMGALAACKRKPPPDQAPPAPVDHLATGEVTEGAEDAFGLKLPRMSSVTGRFRDMVTVVSPLEPEQLANFVRAHVKDGTITTGTSATRFDDVVVVAAPAKHVTIEVRPASGVDGTKSEMLVRDSTPPPLDPNLSEEQRWKKAGLTPDGRIIDRQHLQ